MVWLLSFSEDHNENFIVKGTFMKKTILSLMFLITLATTTTSFARGGGNAFAGSLAGSTMGSLVGTSIASRSSGGSCGGDDRRAMNAVRNLEDDMNQIIRDLKRRIAKLEQKVEKLAQQQGRKNYSEKREE